MAFCTFSAKSKVSLSTLASTPSEPLTVPKSTHSAFAGSSASRALATSDPRLNLFTNSPRWNSPATSSRERSSSVLASEFRRSVNRLNEFSAPRYASSSSASTAVIQLGLKSRASSTMADSLGS